MGIRNAPFARARAMFAAIGALITQFGSDTTGLMQAVGGLDHYTSRGKGCAGRQRSRRCVAHDKRAACKARNRIRNRRAHA